MRIFFVLLTFATLFCCPFSYTQVPKSATKPAATSTQKPSTSAPQKRDSLMHRVADPRRNKYLETKIRTTIVKEHYDPKMINDSFSKKLFWQYLDALDFEKSIFLQEDIDHLKRYEKALDDELTRGTFEFVNETRKHYNERIAYLSQHYEALLKNPFNYQLRDSIVFKEDSLKYARSYEELVHKWYIKLKFMSLQRYYDAIELRNKKTRYDSTKKMLVVKDTADTSFVIKADTTLEREARARVQKIAKKLFFRYKKRFEEQEQIDLYLNMFCTAMDPHTNYMPPLDKRSFDESMSKRFYGIGAQLMEEDGMGMKIVRVITGGAAWKSGQIHQGDIIIKVGQGDAGEYEDMVGYDIEEAVKMIRGAKNTKVRLVLKKSMGGIVQVTLLRKEVKQEESLARSAIIKEGKKKIGYVYLPDFYADFEDGTGAQSAVDVAIEVEKLKRENVDGIIMDLRNNGGGSLTSVVQMVGYFIFKGPVVQIKDRRGAIGALADDLGWLLYSGPLVVMVNEFSASATEIFAAAMQDYERGIVVGTPTYGKGTVQKQIDLKLPSDFNVKKGESRDLGGLKLTVQKFYRISGGTTQINGVTPDIHLPSRYEYAKVRERDNKNHLGWDEIPKTNYKKWDYNSYDLQGVIRDAKKHVDSNKVLSLIEKNAVWLADQRERTRSLNFETYVNEERMVKKIFDTMDKIISLDKDSLHVEEVKNLDTIDTTAFKTQEEKDKWKTREDSYKEFISSVRKDVYIKETVGIMSDVILGGVPMDEQKTPIRNKKLDMMHKTNMHLKISTPKY